ncbi:LeoA/HP0731 family dynamin-like GTPase, partial [Geitlerinema sp. P-1104]|uniref:LeoA/HP0731 family dynamin-like GTPase n=1 Tax=Geitlerinema sp. P-1104 TaxID=2546230 RepID=UPI0014772A67
FLGHSEQDTLFLEGLQRISRRIRDERKRLDVEVRRIALDAHSRIGSLGRDFANEIPNLKEQSDLDTRQKEIEIKLEEIYHEVEEKFNQAIEDSFSSLQDDIKKILNSDFMASFTASVEADGTIPGSSTPPGFDNHKFWDQVKKINDFAKYFGLNPEKMADKIAGQATRRFTKIPGRGYFLRSLDVAGSPLHKTVLDVGKAVGFKFKPFGAVNIAKNLGNAAKVLGPLFGVLSVVSEMGDIQEEDENAKEMRKVQENIRDEFLKISRKCEDQLKDKLNECLTQNYDYIEMQIRSEQEKYNKQQMSNSEQAEQLRKVQGQLKELIQSLRY